MLGLWVQQGDAIFVLKCSTYTQGFFNKNAFQWLGEKLLLLKNIETTTGYKQDKLLVTRLL